MERFYRRIFDALPIRSVVSDENLHLLSPQELGLVRQTEHRAILGAVLIELIAYLVIFLPVYEFPDLFESSTLRIGGPFVHMTGEIQWLRDAWMLIVTSVELYVLLLLNLGAVHGIAVATGYIRRDEKVAQSGELIRIALEQRSPDLDRFGINPFQRMHPWILFLYLAINRLKGLIGSAIIRAALTNIFGREMMRVYLDFSGMPLYMAINAYTTRVILRDARVVVMGQTSIEIMRRQWPKLVLSQWESGLIYDSLQFIAVNKRDYHTNHYYLTKAVIEHFSISVEEAHPLPEDFLPKLRLAREPVAGVCRLIILLGFVLDGTLSWRERRQLASLNQQEILQLSYQELEACRRAFVDGQGLDELTGHFRFVLENTA